MIAKYFNPTSIVGRSARAVHWPVDSRKNEACGSISGAHFAGLFSNTSSQPIFEFTPHARGSMPPRRQLD
jgi:hypothetical protein